MYFHKIYSYRHIGLCNDQWCPKLKELRSFAKWFVVPAVREPLQRKKNVDVYFILFCCISRKVSYKARAAQ